MGVDFRYQRQCQDWYCVLISHTQQRHSRRVQGTGEGGGSVYFHASPRSEALTTTKKGRSRVVRTESADGDLRPPGSDGVYSL